MPSVNTKEKQAGLSLPRTAKHDVRSVDSHSPGHWDLVGKVRLHKMCKQCFREGRSPAKNTINHGIDESGHVADNEPDDTICAATSTHRFGRKTITLSHHVFSNGSGWQQRRSLPQQRYHSWHTCAAQIINTLACHFLHTHKVDRLPPLQIQAARAA